MNLTARDLPLLSQCAISAALRAGHLIAQYSERSVAVHTKAGGTSVAAQVVTEVDHLSQDTIVEMLLPTCEQFDFALLSEESSDDGKRLQKDYFWCVDPLDGTLPFIESVPGYSVSIALVSRAGVPHIGVVYDPLTQTLYNAIRDQGVWLCHASLTRSAIDVPINRTLLFITDKSFALDPLFESTLKELEGLALELGYGGAHLQLQGGAAMNACQVLTSAQACYFKFPKTKTGGGSVWDYAATACLFQEAGLPFSDIHGSPLALNPNGSTFMNHCGILYCSSRVIAEGMVRAYKKLQQCEQ